MMVTFLRDSMLCRLCGENNVNGINLYDDKTKIYVLVNKYLSVNVEYDDMLPKTICPGCHIHLQDTALFLDLIDKGQKKINTLYKEEVERQKFEELSFIKIEPNELEMTNSEFSAGTDNYTETQIEGISLSNNDEGVPEEQVPVKRKRGRPRKSDVIPEKNPPVILKERTARIRKQPVRFNEAVVGKEWENAVNPDGAIMDFKIEEDKLDEEKVQEEMIQPEVEIEEGIIGWIQTKSGKNLGNVLVTRKGKGKVGSVTRLECIICKKVFTHKGHLLRHLLKDHCGESDVTIDDIICPTFNITTTEQEMNILSSEISDIGSINRTKKQYVCLLCQKSYPSRCRLIYHEEKEHTHHIYACNNCDKHFKHRLILLRHQKSHAELRPFACDVCSLTFKYSSNLFHHKMSHTNRGRFICSFCTATFTSKRSLEFHIRVHLGYKPHQCHICHKDFSQKNNLLEHLRVHSGEKPYKCVSCNRDFKTSSQIRTHMLTHSEIKPHTCEICNKSFRHKDSWCAHIRRHTGEKPYSCTHCGKSFLEGTGVRKHERMHTGEKRFACKHCDKPFADCSNLNKHRKKVHGEGTENNLARVIYLNLDLPDQELNHLDLGNITDENNTNSISTLNLALEDCETEMQVSENGLQSKSIPIMFKTLEHHQAMKDKDLNMTLTDIQNQFEATNHLSVPIVHLSSTVGNKVEDNQLPMFSTGSMPLVLNSLEESSCRGKDMPLVLDSVTSQSTVEESLGLTISSNQNPLQVSHDVNRDSLSLAISTTQSQIQELKELSGLVESSRKIVTDGQGVPLKITMSDGTQLQVTTPDGETLEALTSDGVPIPVRLSAPEYDMAQSLPNIDALTMEGALGDLTQLGQDYEIQFVEGHGIKLLPTNSDQGIKLLPSTPVDQSIKLLTSAAEAHGIDLLASTHQPLQTENDDGLKLMSATDKLSNSTSGIDLLSSANRGASIKLLTTSDNGSIKLLTSSSSCTSSLSPPSSPSQLKWTLHQ